MFLSCEWNTRKRDIVLLWKDNYISILSVPDGGYSRKSLFPVTFIYTLLLNSDCNQFYQYQQKEQSSLTSNN
jgi:hypothetical protein